MFMSHHSTDHFGLVLAAGEGTRLQRYVERLKEARIPKQFVNFIGRRSMLEHTFERAEKLLAPEKILTIVGEQHFQHEEARRQLANRAAGTVIAQPANKETGPGILLPLMHLYKRWPEAIVSVFPSDHFILEEDRFMEHVDLAAKAVANDPTRLVLLATEAQGPEVEYGYVLPRENTGVFDLYGTRPVARFIEKPTREIAADLISSGGLWNTMVMVFKVKTVLQMFEQMNPGAFQPFLHIFDAVGTTREKATVDRVYRDLKPMNFSKGFLERVPRLYPGAVHVMPVLQVFWSDWGSRRRVLEVRRVLKQTVRPKPVA